MAQAVEGELCGLLTSNRASTVNTKSYQQSMVLY